MLNAYTEHTKHISRIRNGREKKIDKKKQSSRYAFHINNKIYIEEEKRKKSNEKYPSANDRSTSELTYNNNIIIIKVTMDVLKLV